MPWKRLTGSAATNASPLRRRDDAQAVGLVLVRGQLGEELVVGDAGRGGEAGLGADPGADLLGDPGGDADPLQILGDVEIGLVEAERLDQRRVIGEDRADLVRDRAIGVEARLDEDELGAAALGGDRGHGRADAVFARLVARRRDHAAHLAADRDRLAPQLRIVALLDRRIEGVHVDMDDLALGRRRRHRSLFVLIIDAGRPRQSQNEPVAGRAWRRAPRLR